MNINIFLGIVRLEPWNSSDRGVFLITSTHEVYVLKLGFEFWSISRDWAFIRGYVIVSTKAHTTTVAKLWK